MSVTDTIAYAYNARGELTNAVSNVDASYAYSYQYDDIGNRVSSAECGARSAEYVANELNQYTNIIGGPAASEPEFDDDGNQTLIRTATGEWRVTYNGENRPVLWTCLAATGTTATNGDTIAMSYDRMGRRVTKNAERFVYYGYLQIANHRSTTTTSNYNFFTWDPTEPVATRPLVWDTTTPNAQPSTPQPSTFFYTHDGNKNVSEVVVDTSLPVSAHYEYASFGSPIVSYGTYAAVNTWCFSSEYYDWQVNMAQYILRDYSHVEGVFLTRDNIDHENLYLFVKNRCVYSYDYLGLLMSEETCESAIEQAKKETIVKEKISALEQKKCPIPSFVCSCCSSSGPGFYNPPEAHFWTLWLYKDSGNIHICRNDSKYSETTAVSSVAEVLEHELIHAMQSCQGCLGDNCEKRICAEIQAYLPQYRREVPDYDNRPLISKIELMLNSIVGSCRDICEGKMKTKQDYRNYMINYFEECAK